MIICFSSYSSREITLPSSISSLALARLSINFLSKSMLIISSIEASENYRKLVERKPEVIKKRKMKVYSLDNFHDKFYRLNPEKPCRTIVSHLAKDGNSFIHPFENRSITVREAARIQTFPDDFIFTGSRTVTSQ